MSKLVQAFLSGVFFTFFLDFFLFLGIQLNYIDFYNIDLYYNILFADNQNIYIYLLLTTLLGYLITYVKSPSFALITISILSILSLSTLIEPIGHKVGSIILASENVRLKDNKFTYIGDIYYNGRTEITFYDYDIKKIITLHKKDLKNEK